MDDRLPDPPASPSRRWRHDWFSYEQYQVVHRNYMDRLRTEGVVRRDFLCFVESIGPSGITAVQLAGPLSCARNVIIRIDKKMLVRRDAQNRLEVRTQYYQYHAMVGRRRGSPRRNLVRFDNAHGEHGLHRHDFDANGIERANVPIVLADMPTLDEFIRLAVDLAARPA